jgi:hypothetical protein
MALQTNGPILNVLVHIPTALAQLLSQGTPIPSPQSGIALIDTGASHTCVDESSLVKLGVNPIGVATTRTAAGPANQSRYPVRLEFPGEGLDLEFSSVTGVDLSGQAIDIGAQSHPIVVLVGRDVLSQCVLVYNGPGGFYSLSI